jgi:hypothetical protein
MKNLHVCVLFTFFAASHGAVAQDADPPTRVARIAYMTGAVSFEPASMDEWADASLNYPMTTGDSLYTDDGARAVLRIGQNSLRLNAGTNFQFVNLGDDVVQTSINSGNLSLRIRHLFENESWEVDTPNGAITILRPGQYRFDSDPSRNATMVTVRAGDVQITANDQSFPLHSGQTAYFDNSGSPPDVQDANDPDDFDSFVASRDRLEDVPPPQYVSPDMVGYEDLNANGDWSNTPEYGPVWVPRVAVDWTPYHDGRWAWVEPWGWSWVDAAPWGFAPFHYGRWAYVNNRWGWCPGAVTARVYYAPALVAFVGGGGFSAGVSIGGGGGGLVGWFPLGPREVYYPSYHVSQNYIRQVNVTNTRITNINVTNVTVTNINYVNRNAMVAMPQNSFASAQQVQRTAVRIDAAQMRQAQVIGAAPRVAPRPESVLANGGVRRSVAPPAVLANRPVVARLAPPPRAVPFAAKQQALEQNPGTPVAPAQLRTLRTQVDRQSPAPQRMQVQAIDTKQVRAVAPTVRPGPAPSFAQRAAQPQNRGAQAPVQKPNTQPVPAARPQNIPPAREQAQPPARQAPADREQAPPPVRQAPAVREQPQPPVRQAPAIREQPKPPVTRDQPQPTVRQATPAPEQPKPQVRQAPETREQAQPPARSAPPTREQPNPPVRQAPAEREPRATPPPRQQAPPPRQQAQPQRQPPQKAPPDKKVEKKNDDKKE